MTHRKSKMPDLRILASDYKVMGAICVLGLEKTIAYFTNII